MSKKEKAVKEPEVTVVEKTPVAQEGEFKISTAKKMRNLGKESLPTIAKLDLSKQTKKEETNAIQVGETKEVDVDKPTEPSQEVDHKVQIKSDENVAEKQKVDSPLQLITDEDDTKDVVAKDISKQKETPSEVEKQILPENIEKLIQFMEETGGTIEDYTRLNADYSNINDDALLHEYYKKARPHLDQEEREFVIEKESELLGISGCEQT